MSIGEHLQHLLKVMDDLEGFLEYSKLRFLGKVVVDEEAFYTLFNKLRVALPKEIKEMEMMVKEASRIKSAAEEEGKKVVENAREYAKALVEEHEIVKQAEVRAEEIKTEAAREGEQIQQEAKAYAKKVFEKFLQSLEQLEGIARDTLQNL